MGEVRLYLLASAALVVPFIYTFRLHRPLLLERPGSTGTLLVLLTLTFAAWIFALSRGAARADLGFAVGVTTPIVHFWAFRFGFRFFVRRNGREPEDMAFNWTPNRFPDRLFAIVFVLGCVYLTMLLSGILLWGTGKPGHGAG